MSMKPGVRGDSFAPNVAKTTGEWRSNRSNAQETSHGVTSVPLEASAHPNCASTSDEKRKVDWIGSTDPANPRNWSPRKRWGLIVMNSAITFCQAMSSTMFAPAVPQAMVDLGSKSDVVSQLMVSIYVLGLAAGPLILSPLSECYGRSSIMHITNFLFTLAAVVGALSHNVTLLLVCRLTLGISTISLGGAYVADLIDPEDRGRAMNVWNIGPVLAPIAGPIIGGYITLTIGWRWTYGLGSIWLFMCFALLPETYAPRLLELKARRAHTIEAPVSSDGIAISTQRRRALLQSLGRPWRMLIHSPATVVVSLFGAIAYSDMYLMFSTFTEVFQSIYDFNAGGAGLVYLGFGFGSIAAQVAIEFFGRWQAKERTITRSTVQPEHHLPLLVTAGAFIACGHVIYGWTLQCHLHWLVPIAGTGLSGFGVILVFQAVQAYLVETHTIYAASAIALSVAIRCVFGLTIPLAGPPLFHHLGYGWGNSLLALIALGMIPVSLILLRYGTRLRERTRADLVEA
ncbi:putative transporter [Cercospora beticola]|uniref:Putative transporter n=1 Tax=Cercospora beticola TaxID=122368 RepID=A0A2G5HU00_CERBT|nr:putative transporter [Cercospora beticola]PIA96005.1 putative transporter [Cercospora beticola]